MTVPSPAELQWRISHLAGLAPSPPPKTSPYQRLQTLIRCAMCHRADALHRQAERELVAVFGTPPAQIGRYAASIAVAPCACGGQHER